MHFSYVFFLCSCIAGQLFSAQPAEEPVEQFNSVPKMLWSRQKQRNWAYRGSALSSESGYNDELLDATPELIPWLMPYRCIDLLIQTESQNTFDELYRFHTSRMPYFSLIEMLIPGPMRHDWKVLEAQPKDIAVDFCSYPIFPRPSKTKFDHKFIVIFASGGKNIAESVVYQIGNLYEMFIQSLTRKDFFFLKKLFKLSQAHQPLTSLEAEDIKYFRISRFCDPTLPRNEGLFANYPALFALLPPQAVPKALPPAPAIAAPPHVISTPPDAAAAVHHRPPIPPLVMITPLSHHIASLPRDIRQSVIKSFFVDTKTRRVSLEFLPAIISFRHHFFSGDVIAPLLRRYQQLKDMLVPLAPAACVVAQYSGEECNSMVQTPAFITLVREQPLPDNFYLLIVSSTETIYAEVSNRNAQTLAQLSFAQLRFIMQLFRLSNPLHPLKIKGGNARLFASLPEEMQKTLLHNYTLLVTSTSSPSAAPSAPLAIP